MRFALCLLAIAVAFVALKVLLLDRLPMPWHHTNLRPDGTLRGVAVPLDVNFDGRARLLGMDSPPDSFAADAAPVVRFYAQALDHAGRDWRLGLTLLDPDGRRWMPDSLRAPRATRAPPPMPEWSAFNAARSGSSDPDRLTSATYALWAYHIDVLPGAPPGTYTLAVSLFDRDTLVPASVLGPDGNPQGPSLPLRTLQLARPTRPPTLAELGILDGDTSGTLDEVSDRSPRLGQETCGEQEGETCGEQEGETFGEVLDADVILSAVEGSPPCRCSAMGLWSMTADRTSAAPGGPVGLRWIWEAIDAPSEVLTMTVTLHLVAPPPPTGGIEGGKGVAVHTWSLPPVAAWWPTDRWLAGDRWVGRHVLRLPGGLTSGRYQFVASLPGCEAMASVSLDVDAPPRIWEIPTALHPRDVVLGDQVRLAGVAVTPRTLAPGETAQVTLAWQALAEMTTSYRIFLHILAPGGQIVAQNDGEPVAWTRPTTGWAVGEVVVEIREVQIPGNVVPGTYTLQVGLYLPEDGRLRTTEGGDAVQVGALDVR